jgi:hypothetical protein
MWRWPTNWPYQEDFLSTNDTTPALEYWASPEADAQGMGPFIEVKARATDPAIFASCVDELA